MKTNTFKSSSCHSYDHRVRNSFRCHSYKRIGGRGCAKLVPRGRSQSEPVGSLMRYERNKRYGVNLNELKNFAMSVEASMVLGYRTITI
jgi:hypothetical protein